jgi:hypothetical protein
MTASILQPVQPTFRAVAETVVPATSALRPEAWQELQQTVERALALRPVAMQRQLVTFLRLIEWLPFVRYGSRFSHLNPKRRVHVLTKLQNAPSLLIRRGFWGLRTLVMMGYYTRADVQQAIGYRAHPNGWSARRTGTTGEHAAVPEVGRQDGTS